jgi:hypothetical protein
MDLIGEWDVVIKTPIGSLQVLYTFTNDSGALTGTAAGKGETVALRDITVAAQRVTWRQSVTKPMRLNLEFDVVVDGDRLTGHSRAGRLPRSAVTGVRRQGRIS